MEQLLSSLVSAVETEPRGLRPTHFVQQLLSYCLQALLSNDEEQLAQLAERSATAARELRPKDLESEELWRAWYAGQLQTVTSLLRVHLRQTIPAAVKRRVLTENNAAILLALDGGDELTQAELRAKTHINDPSQFSRHVAALRDIQVVDVAKDGRNAWVRLSALGRRVVSTLREQLGHAVGSRHEERVAAVAADSDGPSAFLGAPPGMVGASEDDTLRLHLSRPTPTGVVLPENAYSSPDAPKRKRRTVATPVPE